MSESPSSLTPVVRSEMLTGFISQCYSQFTTGQETRMFQMWDMYRAGK